MKIIFAGTPDIAATILTGLLGSEHQVIAVLTQPDRPCGRGQKVVASPVKTLALQHNISVYQPEKLSEPDIQDKLKAMQADLMVVVAYGLIIPQAVLDIPRLGCWNVHVSLLPRWRGAAPIQRAIEAGDTQTGVTLMQMDKGLDTGPILLQEKVTIGQDMTSRELHDLLAAKGSDLLLQGLNLQLQNKLTATSQPNENISYAHKITKEEARIDWSEPAAVIECKIRAFNPWPVAYTTYNDQVIRLWQAKAINHERPIHIGQIQYIRQDAIGIATGEGILEILELQLAAGKRLPVTTFLNGHRDFFVEEAILI